MKEDFGYMLGTKKYYLALLNFTEENVGQKRPRNKKRFYG